MRAVTDESLTETFNSKEDIAAALPSVETRHWVPRYKAAVVAAVRNGVLSFPDACHRYRLTEEEFTSWIDAIDQHGIVGLKANMQAERRKSVRTCISEAALAMLQGSEGVDCVMTDISDQGACIRFDGPVSLPNTFELRCVASGRSWWVTVIWDRLETVGVRFSNPLPPPWVIKSGLGAWLLGQRRTVSIDAA